MKTKLHKTAGDAMIELANKINLGKGIGLSIQQNDNGWYFLGPKPKPYRVSWAGHFEDDMMIVGPDNYTYATVRTANFRTVAQAKRIAHQQCEALNEAFA